MNDGLAIKIARSSFFQNAVLDIMPGVNFLTVDTLWNVLQVSLDIMFFDPRVSFFLAVLQVTKLLLFWRFSFNSKNSNLLKWILSYVGIEIHHLSVFLARKFIHDKYKHYSYFFQFWKKMFSRFITESSNFQSCLKIKVFWNFLVRVLWYRDFTDLFYLSIYILNGLSRN